MYATKGKHSLEEHYCKSSPGETCAFSCTSGHRRVSCGCCTLGSVCAMHVDDRGIPPHLCPTCEAEAVKS